MKNKILLTLTLLLFASAAFAQDFKGIKICINPGHGGHDPDNDRYIPATGFWESDGNIEKGLYVRDIMKSLGAEIIMTRVTNEDADDLPLSQIVSIANQNNVNHMHSIHSNAAGSTNYANYTLILFQGFDSAPTYPLSKTMATAIGNEIYAAHRSAYLTIRGDFDFYGTGRAYLGVFKGLNMPGTLSEGSFHDYVPESFRLLNASYKKHEAWAITKGFIQFWGKSPLSNGIIAGVVRDPEAKVSYSSINALDAMKPVNNVKITLQPGNKIYNGDNKNNGFFMFDSVTPGKYKLYYEAAGYMNDSAEVTVEANKNSFADIYLQVYSPTVPRVTACNLSSLQDSVKAIDPIKINFNIPMQSKAFEQSITISPKANLTFTWENNNRVVTIKPQVPFQGKTKYTLTLPAVVKSVSNINSDTVYTYSFTTKYRNRLNIVSCFPSDGQTKISPLPQIRILFDVPLLATSLTGNINMFGPNNEKLGLARTKVLVQNGRGLIYFEPATALQTNANYRVEMGSKVSDAEGYNLVDTLEINFKTDYEKYVSGKIVDSLEVVKGWNNPSFSGSTVGVDTTNSKFELVTDKKMSGLSSGKITCIFSGDSSGVCRVYNSAKPSIGNAPDFGMWIFGDLSYNSLEYWFYYNGSTNYIVKADTINWAGWKFMKVSLAGIPSTGDKLFHSIVIRQNKNAQKSSVLYFDDPQYGIVTPVEKDENTVHPEKYALEQNYPNPFNPSTTISYSIPENSFVTLKVYDLIGREVASLVNDNQIAGNYKVSFNASRLPSGVYIYKLNAGKFSQSKKLSLIK